ncbi:carboxymuconolactone decarboxylase family protein [Enterococcus sp. 669A]|uniref:Carboxymuconolactone decarboxylase family protein n=1 Tax=Candidatus Enterococcus moelleringii TaxID=2815325 RepID=A0ABS3LCM0_9ENTE|nr:carboxymuconolactone decarboxylase family protein [Enterococcus sp. 669A]MBO1307378.1 carboxymuconolactone decarboxylase family protein [Enterococcus sp. 669A]
MNKFERGLKIREQIIGEKASGSVTDSLKDIAPILDKYTQVAFDEMSNRDALNMQQREMITLTTLVTQGDTASQLRVHIQGALNVGLSQEEIVEIFIQCLPYVGFPKVLNAVSVAKEVFKQSSN